MGRNMNDKSDLAALLKRMAPPDAPSGAITIDPMLASAISKFDGIQLARVLGGLQTDPAYQANNVRLDWGGRLALALGTGRRHCSRDELSRLLNQRLKNARVTRLEDPIEDVSVEPICTLRGEYLIFTGTWEKAGHFTESVMTAFDLLPEGGPKDEALAQSYALLRVSDELVRRAALPRYTMGGGEPNSELKIPASKRLSELARRVLFTWGELEKEGFTAEHLAPFVFEPEHLGLLLDQIPGDSLLEFQPLIAVNEGLMVIAPANLSTAIRGRLINCAIAGGLGEVLLCNILAVQSQLITNGGLMHVRGPTVRFAKGFAREHIEEISLGRFLHVLSVIDEFGHWPNGAFAISDRTTPEFGEKITASVIAAREFAVNQEGFTSGVSFVFLCGWGSGHTLEVEWPDELLGWRVIFLEAQDGFILGGCEDGDVEDLIWMDLQLHQVREQGFDFHHVNGFLNLFQWWRNTEHSFVPPHTTDAEPPLMINFDSNLLLQARREGLLAWDRRALQLPSGDYLVLMRTQPKTIFENLESIYGSYDLARKGMMIAAVLIDDRYPVWFELENDMSQSSFENAHETFNALLSWASRILPPSLSPQLKGSELPVRVRLKVEITDESLHLAPRMTDEDIDRTVQLEIGLAKREAIVTLAPAWQLGLNRPDNYAEAVLARSILDGIARLLGIKAPEDGIAFVRTIVGGVDARWRHMLEATNAIGVLKAHGLVPRFNEIPTSAAALIKTGLAWATHPRAKGSVIGGKEACRAFLNDQVSLLLASLRNSLRRFRRDSLVPAVLDAMQAAQADEMNWDMSARAHRAIHGVNIDHAVSLRRRMAINSVLRACTILAELGLVECSLTEGRLVGKMDVSELEAHAVCLFQTADLIPAIEGGQIEPLFNISPTGDLLFNRSFEDNTLRRSTKIIYEKMRDEARGAYLRRFDQPSISGGLSPVFERAVEAEYGAVLDTVVRLPNECAHLATERGQGVFSIKRSELISYFDIQNANMAGIERTVDRLTLRPRDNWDTIPLGTTDRDFDLAKFDRRYSLVGRPLLAIDKSDNPILIVAPGLIERCLIHNLDGALQGTLQGEFWSSVDMRKYAGDRGRIEGMQFNEEVAEKLRSLGLTAYPSAKPSWCFNHKSSPEVVALGDFDVLAITPDGKRAWIIEAKDLKLCRTIGETARRLSEYEGRLRANGKPDKMLRHLRRVFYARQHARDMQKRLDLACVPEIAGIMVVRAPQPMESMPRVGGNDARVVMLTNLAEVPWSIGWSSKTLLA